MQGNLGVVRREADDLTATSLNVSRSMVLIFWFRIHADTAESSELRLSEMSMTMSQSSQETDAKQITA